MTVQVDRLVERFGKLDATMVSAETAIAEHILTRVLFGYRVSKKNFRIDVIQLADAIQAYAKLLQDNGVKVQ